MNFRLLLAMLLPTFLVCTHLRGQTELPLNYQAVIRDANGNLLKEKAVNLQFSFYDTTSTITPAYVEQHSTTTTELGYVQLLLGTGDQIEGAFEDILWAGKAVSLEIELDEGNGWTSLGIDQFNTVPFSEYAEQANTALNAEKATNMFINDLKDVSTANPTLGYVLRWNGETWSPSKDADVQTLQLEGNILRISNGNEITLPTASSNLSAGNGISIQNNIIVNTGDTDPSDDITTSSQAGGKLSGTFSNLTLNDNSIESRHLNDGTITLADLARMGAGNGQTLKWSDANQGWIIADDEIGNKQTLSINNNTLSISDGNSVNLPSQSNYAPGPGISIQGLNIINTGDVDASDDLLRTSNFSGDISGTFNNLSINSGAVSEAKIATGAISNTKLASASVTGTKIASMGANSGQVLKWTGTTWGPANDEEGLSFWNPSGANLSNVNIGNIGIGLPNPSAKLHVLGDGSYGGGIRISSPGSNNAGASLLLDGSNVDWALVATNSGFAMGANKFIIRNQTFGNTPLVINSNGNVGMNDDDPAAKLSIKATNGESNTLTVSSTTASNSNIILKTDYTGNASAQRDVIAIQGKAISGTGFGIGANVEGGNYGLKAVGSGSSANKAVYGVYGEASGNSGSRYGVYGIANGATGVNINYGIYGTTSGMGFGNYAGYFQGNVHVSGTLSKSSGSFKIDHPADPTNKYLVHSFVESPDMMNVYNGNVVTDKNGFATVTLPDYFEMLNKDFRYQLTVIGTFAQAIVKEKVQDNHFVIQTSEPGVEVSWQVTGIRKDPYAEKYRIQPVVEKPAAEKGTYLNPEVYEEANEKALGHPKSE
jgi:hypothetical protein